MEHYEEIELIGKGTYGKVFKVRSKAEDEVYVIKKVQFDGTPQSEAEAALREGQVLSLLRHPHVVPYKEFFKHTDGDLCLVMAFCEGGDLFRYIRELRKHGKTVPEPQVWQWLVQLLLSLSYIHTKRILHRDVKTQNIFLSGGKVLLGDFGLAKQLQRTFEMARTPIGTPYYMAPEIYEEQPYSFKSDVWALGCVMYEMMTGKAAFAADNLSRVVLRVIRGQYDPLPDSYSTPLRQVVTSMLCKDVKSRPDANQLLTVAPVIPHVQSYLESLTAEGPSGWATWRMKLPLAAMVQMSEALEAAGVPLSSGRRSQTGTAPSSNRTSNSGTGPGDTPDTYPPEPSFAPEPPAPAPSTPDPNANLSPTGVSQFNLSSRNMGLGGGAGGALGGGGAGAAGGQVVKLPPLPGTRLPPVRTPYGLATPFMGAVHPQQHYAELHMLAHQVMAIRTSHCGDGGPDLVAGIGINIGPNGAVLAGGAGGPGDGRPVAAAAVVTSNSSGPPAPATPATSTEVPEEVKALDRTLIKTLEIARKAAADSAPVDAKQGGGKAEAGGIDEAWLSAGLPQGGFGFGGHGHSHSNSPTPAPAPVAAPPKEAPSSSDISLPPIHPRRVASAHRQAWSAGSSHALAHSLSHNHVMGHPHALAAPGTPEPSTPSPAAPQRAGHYEVPDEGFASMSHISLHAQSLSNRRVNLQQYCAELLGDELMQQVMQAVTVAKKHSRSGGDVDVAEAALRRQLDRLLLAGDVPEGPRLRQELGPLIEEMALLHC